MLQAQQGRLDKVESGLVSRVKANHPEATPIMEALIQGYRLNYRFPLALRCIDAVLEHEPNNVHVLYWRGLTLEDLSELKDALATYRKVVELVLANEDARLRLAQTLVHFRRTEEAQPHFEWLQERRPSNSAVLLGLARCRHSHGQTSEARALLEDVLAREPRNAQALIERGRLSLESGQLAEAEGCLRKAIQLAPGENVGNYLLYQCLHELGKQSEAEEFLAKFKRFEADLQRMQVLQRQIRETPHDAALLHEAGMIFLRTEKPEAGVRWLQSALQEDPNHVPTHQALAEYYERTGQPELAQKHRRMIPSPK
jgi:predicted Zn-dependent protease